MKTLALTVLIALAGCGNDDNKGSGVVSCDVTMSGVHSCSDFSTTGGDLSGSEKQACDMAKGTTGTGCSHTGTNGGCRFDTTSGGITLTTTAWYYDIPAATIMMTCPALPRATFVAP